MGNLWALKSSLESRAAAHDRPATAGQQQSVATGGFRRLHRKRIFIKYRFEHLKLLAGDHFPRGSTDLPSTGFGTSPMTVFRGQTENAGHFAHPTANAMGQSVMTAPLAVKRRAYADVDRLPWTSIFGIPVRRSPDWPGRPLPGKAS
jgi:hypothetical protein